MNPETASSGSGGTTAYTYDSDSTCGTTTYDTGSLVKRIDPASNVTCYLHDGIHRVTQISYPSGPNSANTQTKFYRYDGPGPYWGITQDESQGPSRGGRNLRRLPLQYLHRRCFQLRPAGSNHRPLPEHAKQRGPVSHIAVLLAEWSCAHIQGFYSAGSAFSDQLIYDATEGEGRPKGLSDAQLGGAVWTGTTPQCDGRAVASQCAGRIREIPIRSRYRQNDTMERDCDERKVSDGRSRLEPKRNLGQLDTYGHRQPSERPNPNLYLQLRLR